MQKEQIRLNADKIIPYENNPRFNNNAVEVVKESILQCGYISPIVVDENNVVLAGHTRLKALLDIGHKEIEVLKVTGLDEEQKTKYRLLDNKTGELAEWDFEKLAKELDKVNFGDFDFGFDVEEVDFSDLYEEREENEQKDKKPETITCPHCNKEFEL